MKKIFQKKRRESIVLFGQFPKSEDLLRKIFQYLNLLSVSICCSAFHKVASSDYIWKQWGNPNWDEKAKEQGWKAIYIEWIQKQFHRCKELQKEEIKFVRNASKAFGDGEFKKWMEAPIEPIKEIVGPYDLRIKICIEGGVISGKTTFVTKLLGKYNDSRCTGTLMYKIRDRKIQVDIWDANGQEKFKSTDFWWDFHGNLFIYDITNAESFEAITSSIEFVPRDFNGGPEYAIVGNKKDLRSQRQVEPSHAKELLKKYVIYPTDVQEVIKKFEQLVHLGEVSAATGEGLDEVMEKFTRLCIAKIAASPLLYLGGGKCKDWPNRVPTIEELRKAYYKPLDEKKKECLLQ